MTTIADLPREILGDIIILADNFAAWVVSRGWNRAAVQRSPNRDLVAAYRLFYRARAQYDRVRKIVPADDSEVTRTHNIYRWRMYKLLREYSARFREIMSKGAPHGRLGAAFYQCVHSDPLVDNWFRYGNGDRGLDELRCSHICGYSVIVRVRYVSRYVDISHVSMHGRLSTNSFEIRWFDRDLALRLVRLYRSIVTTTSV